MTYPLATASTIGGVLALVLTALNFNAAWRIANGTAAGAPELPFSRKGVWLMGLSNHFASALFGLISVAHAEALASTALGASLCLGMCVYFFLKGWGYLRAPEMREMAPYIGTYLAFGSAVFYAIVVVGYVI